jgi:adenylosuccinate synthase
MGATAFEVEALVGQAPAGASGSRAPRRHDVARPGALGRGEHVLLEGAQGTLLDLDHGSYPFVTSSNAGRRRRDDRWRHRAAPGRRGHGRHEGLRDARRLRAVPDGALDEIGEGIAERGHEVGTTTGRPRRVGWFDAVPLALRGRGQLGEQHHAQQARHPVRLETIRCAWRTRSTAAGRALAVVGGGPRARDADLRGVRRLVEPIHDVRSLAGLPGERAPLRHALEELRGVPIVLVSVGPERTQTIERAWRPMRRAPRWPVVSHGADADADRGLGAREHALAWKLAASRA